MLIVKVEIVLKNASVSIGAILFRRSFLTRMLRTSNHQMTGTHAVSANNLSKARSAYGWDSSWKAQHPAMEASRTNGILLSPFVPRTENFFYSDGGGGTTVCFKCLNSCDDFRSALIHFGNQAGYALTMARDHQCLPPLDFVEEFWKVSLCL